MATKYIKLNLAIFLAAGLLTVVAAPPFAALAAPLQRQGISIGVPIVGYVFDDEARTVRSIVGRPDSSIVSEPFDLGSFRQVAVAQGYRFAVAITEDTNQPVVVKLDRGFSAMQAIPNVPPGADSLVLGPSGRSAAIYYRNEGVVQVLKGLPDSAVILGTVAVKPEAQLRSLAVSDNGATILASLAEDGINSLVLMSIDGSSRHLFATGGPAQITFLYGRQDSILVDQSNGDVFLFRDPALSGELMALPIRETIGVPVGAAVSYDNRHAFFASAETGMTARIDLATGSLTTASCGCKPEGLFPLNRNSLFRLNRLQGDSIWIYDGGKREPQSYVVPVPGEAH